MSLYGADGRITDILGDHVVAYSGLIGDNIILMHDNARPHTVLCVRECINEVGSSVLDWLARGPDLNPIEHLWDELKRRIRQREPALMNLAQLKIALVQEWNNIPQSTIKNLIMSLSKRMVCVIKARGGNAPYWCTEIGPKTNAKLKFSKIPSL